MPARSLARPRRQNSHRADAEKRCPGFLQWIRGRACTLAGRPGHECHGQVRACHVDHGGDKGMGTKASDRFAIPMCDGAHAEQHSTGWRSFEAIWQINALAIAGDLWSHWLNNTTMGANWKARGQ